MASSEITVIAQFTAMEGRERELRDELLALVEPASHEPGVLRFELYEAANNPRILTAIDTFADQAALDSHVSSPPVSRFFNEVLPAMAESTEVTPQRAL